MSSAPHWSPSWGVNLRLHRHPCCLRRWQPPRAVISWLAKGAGPATRTLPGWPAVSWAAPAADSTAMLQAIGSIRRANRRVLQSPTVVPVAPPPGNPQTAVGGRRRPLPCRPVHTNGSIALRAESPIFLNLPRRSGWQRSADGQPREASSISAVAGSEYDTGVRQSPLRWRSAPPGVTCFPPAVCRSASRTPPWPPGGAVPRAQARARRDGRTARRRRPLPCESPRGRTSSRRSVRT
jgi:hypothetical protein